MTRPQPVPAPRSSVCYLCGNDATQSHALVIDPDDRNRVIHNPFACDAARDEDGEIVWIDDMTTLCRHPDCAYEDDGGPCPCPPVPDGMAQCAWCGKAQPFSALAYAQEVDTPTYRYVPMTASGTLNGGAIPPGAALDKAGAPIYVCWNFAACVARFRAHLNAEGPAAAPRRVDPAIVEAGWWDALPIGPDSDVPPPDALTKAQLCQDVWHCSMRTADARLKRPDDRVRSANVATGAGGQPRKVYWRIKS